jgi:hypothetical protein
MITESLLNKEGVADGIGHRREDSPQITVFSDLAEHFPDVEGLEGVAWLGALESRWNRRHSGSRCLGARMLGTGFGDGDAQLGRNGWWLRTWFASCAF